MFSKAGLRLSLLGFTTVVLSAPMEHRLEDIQCRCLSFSESAKPTLCTYLESHGLDWDTAYSLAADNDLKIEFASQTTITKVLAIPKPLPSSVLQTLSQGEALPLDPAELMKSENKIVCGLDDEVKHMGSFDRNAEPEMHCVAVVVGAFMMVLIIYVVGQYIWARYTTQEGTIKLEGDEKNLTAELDHVESATPTDFS